RHTRSKRDWSSDVCSSDLLLGITWVTKPLQQVYNLIQSRFIGLIPGNYTEPSSSDYSTMSTIFGFIDTGVSQNDAGSILSASNRSEERRVGKECKYRRATN